MKKYINDLIEIGMGSVIDMSIDKVVMEDEVYRVSCEYNNQLIVQKLNLSNTATRDGQIAYSKTVQLEDIDETFSMSDLTDKYLIPGQRRK